MSRLLRDAERRARARGDTWRADELRRLRATLPDRRGREAAQVARLAAYNRRTGR